MKIKTLAHSIWGRVSFTLLLSFLVLSQTANADVTNCNTEKREDIDKREDKEIDKKQEKKQKLEQMFEAFWALYPKKINKRQESTLRGSVSN